VYYLLHNTNFLKFILGFTLNKSGCWFPRVAIVSWLYQTPNDPAKYIERGFDSARAAIYSSPPVPSNKSNTTPHKLI
jgi:hypothetical protein